MNATCPLVHSEWGERAHSSTHVQLITSIDMEADPRSRAWIVTSQWEESEFNDEQMRALLTSIPVAKAHGLYNRINGTASWFMYMRFQVRASALTSIFKGGEDIVIHRSSAGKLSEFMRLTHDRSIDLTFPQGDTISMDQVSTAHVDSVDNSSDEEVTILIKLRKSLRRKIKDLRTIEDQLKATERALVERFTP